MIAVLLAASLQMAALNETYEATIKLPSGNFQKVEVSAASFQNAREMLYLQYCREKKNCIIGGPFRVR